MTKRLTRKVVRNSEELYEHEFKKRGVKYIDQLPTARLHHPTAKQIATLDLKSHVWKVGDRFYKLAHQYYGDSRLWWILAWFNQKPTDSHVKTGDVVTIPLPLSRALAVLRKGA
tara:strand:- start:207 stop:548 length:342 start_codon:yes stop_codon:yes gene_type:complete